MIRRAEDGFTLIETLVALAIVALSFAVLLRTVSDGLERTRRASDEATALSLMQSLMTQTEAARIAPGTSRGTFGGGFAWRLRIAPRPGLDAKDGWPVDAVNVTATVSWNEGGLTETRSLSTVRVIPRPVTQ